MTLAELKKLAEAATPGPWHIGHISEIYPSHMDIDGKDKNVAEEVEERNAAFICAANPATILQLINRYEKACGALELIIEFGRDAYRKGTAESHSFNIGKAWGCAKDAVSQLGPDVPLEEK